MAEPSGGLPQSLDRRFEAVIFDWDGTAVADRSADASGLRRLLEELCAEGMDLAVVSGTHLDNVDGQLGARPSGSGALHLLLNRGSEVFRVGEAGPQLVERRAVTPEEDKALDTAAALAVERLAQRGLEANIVSQRLNRRKIDLIPLPEWADPPKARIAELLAAVEDGLRQHGIAGLKQAVEIAEGAAAEVGLAAARVTSDAKHVEIGLTDKSDSARWMLADLWRRGIGPGLVLIAGDEMGSLGGVPGSDANLLVPEAERAAALSVGAEPGGPPPGVAWLGGGPGAFVTVLDDQLARRKRGEVPELDRDPAWTLAIDGVDPHAERAHEALLTLADGRIGTRGTPLAEHLAAAPLVIAAGAYRGAGATSELRPAPLWNTLGATVEPEASMRRALDLHTGLMEQEIGGEEGSLRALLFSSLARPGTAVLRAHGTGASLSGDPPLRAAAGEPAVDAEQLSGERHWMWTGDEGGGIGAAASETLVSDGPHLSRDRIATYRSGREGARARTEALAELEAAAGQGFERLLIAHRHAWARRWEAADIEIDGDPELQLAVRVALFHLMASVADRAEAAVGARGLTGSAYRGHVFWDADVFVLPFLAATHPESARAILEYRARRLPAALAAARRSGRSGARFPWESAATGKDVTPTSAFDRAGRALEIHTGQLEEHIVADVAWATSHYLEWSGDEGFLGGAGGRLLIETARYWASRIERDADGSAHIRHVIGPDEYHVGVDDNAYTNVMARWNLRRAAELDPAAAGGVGEEERDAWLASAEALVDGYSSKTGIYEQFAGFFGLEPLVIADLAPSRPIAADLLLGPEQVGSSQVVKQADVLMLHHLVPDEVAPGSLAPNLRFYEPRTAHASSLSPGVHAALFAHMGNFDDALAALRLTSRIDLDDISETTAGGVHLAAMGSLWQALAFGFGGIRAVDGVLRVDPRLPPSWKSLTVRMRFRGARLRLRLDESGARFATDRPIRVAVGADAKPETVAPGTRHIEHHQLPTMERAE